MSKAKFLSDFNSNYKEREFDTQETMKQINHFGGTNVWCWGISNRYNLNNGGLLLQVNGQYLKGFVLVTLGFDDTYTIRFFNTQYNEVKGMDKITGVYFDDLANFIDGVIEFKN